MQVFSAKVKKAWLNYAHAVVVWCPQLFMHAGGTHVTAMSHPTLSVIQNSDNGIVLY